MTRLACHPKPGHSARVRIHGTVPGDVATTLLGMELQMLIDSTTLLNSLVVLARWEGGLNGIRFRVNKGGAFDLTAPYDHPVVQHLREALGHQFWGLTDFPTFLSWDTVRLLAPTEVMPYRPKGEHQRSTKSAMERLLEAEHREWAGTITRQDLRDVANAVKHELNVEGQ